jgi:general secretion pathway protein H
MRGGRKQWQSGFTLVELLVVLVIIGLAAAAVVLAIPDPEGSLQTEAERFAARTKAARDLAIVESRPALLRIEPNGYSVSRRSEGVWQEAESYDWANGTEVEVGGAEGAQSRFDSTGLAQPLQVTLRRRDRRVAIAIGEDGSVRVQR